MIYNVYVFFNGVFYKNVNCFKVLYDVFLRNIIMLFVLKSLYLCFFLFKNSRGSLMCLRVNFGFLRVYVRN